RLFQLRATTGISAAVRGHRNQYHRAWTAANPAERLPRRAGFTDQQLRRGSQLSHGLRSDLESRRAAPILVFSRDEHRLHRHQGNAPRPAARAPSWTHWAGYFRDRAISVGVVAGIIDATYG